MNLKSEVGIKAAIDSYLAINRKCDYILNEKVNTIPSGGLELIPLIVSTNNGLIEALEHLLEDDESDPQVREQILDKANKSMELLVKVFKVIDSIEALGLFDFLKSISWTGIS